MLFNSLEFAIFLPIVFTLYWLLPHRFRWVLLFISSYWFYMSWNPKYVFLILFTTLISFFAALGVLFIRAAADMEPGTGQTIFYIFGVLDIIWAGWILFSYLRRR